MQGRSQGARFQKRAGAGSMAPGDPAAGWTAPPPQEDSAAGLRTVGKITLYIFQYAAKSFLHYRSMHNVIYCILWWQITFIFIHY